MKYFVVGVTEDRIGELIGGTREAKLFNPDRPPTGTLLGVNKLTRGQLLAENELIAAIPD